MSKIKYLYILSQRYSGSTLLSFLLGTHPEIATIGERRKFYVNSIADGGRGLKCSCGEPFQQCTHWNKIKENVLNQIGKENIHLNPTEFQLFKNKYLNRLAYESLFATNKWSIPINPFRNRVKKQLDFNQKLVEEILKIEKKSVFLDSSKSIQHLLFLSQIEAFDIHVIWLSRDPRAQVFSALKYNKWSVEEAAKIWEFEMNESAKILKDLKLNYSEVSYESLCENPEEEISNILNDAGLNPELFSLDFRSQEQHIMGNYAMRLGSDNQIEVRNEWETGLSDKDIATIQKNTVRHLKVN